jgi:hypothetical protein
MSVGFRGLINPIVKAIARQTYEFPQCMQDMFSNEQWQIEELESFEPQPLSYRKGRLCKTTCALWQLRGRSAVGYSR